MRIRYVFAIISVFVTTAAIAGEPQRPEQRSDDPPAQPAFVSSNLSAFEAAVRSKAALTFHPQANDFPTAATTFPYAVIRDKATDTVVGPVLALDFGTGGPAIVSRRGLMAYPVTSSTDWVMINFDQIQGSNDVQLPFSGRIYLPTPDCTGTQWYINAAPGGLQTSRRYFTITSATPNSFLSLFASDVDAVPSQVSVQSAVFLGTCEHYNSLMISALPATVVFSITGRHPNGLRFSAP